MEEASARVRAHDTTLEDIGITFEANWMVIVTWERVPAFKAEYTDYKVGLVEKIPQLYIFGINIFHAAGVSRRQVLKFMKFQV